MPVTKKDYRWIKLAAKFAEKSSHHKYMFGSLIVVGGRLINVGLNSTNKRKFYVKAEIDDLKHHSEVDACYQVAKKRFKDATVYVAGRSVGGNRVLSRPCNTCYRYLSSLGIKRIVYHNQNGDIFEEKLTWNV